MSDEAKELRELAIAVWGVTGDSRISAIAMPAVQALCDYLTLQARVMELEAERNAWEAKSVRSQAGRPAHLTLGSEA